MIFAIIILLGNNDEIRGVEKMKKGISIASFFALLFVAIPVFAASSGTGTQTQQRLQVSPSPAGNMIQNQNQVKTKNEGEESQIQTNTQEQENFGGSQGTQGQGMPKETSPKSEIAAQNMSNVAQKVEELLTTKTMQGGIGQQVKVIAQEQKMAQEQIQAELGNIDSRAGLLKSIIGPDFKALKNMQKQMEQNQLRIQQLTQFENQLTNQGDITQVQEMIQALTDQNTALQDRVNLEEQSGSLLGWLFKLMAK